MMSFQVGALQHLLCLNRDDIKRTMSILVQEWSTSRKPDKANRIAVRAGDIHVCPGTVSNFTF